MPEATEDTLAGPPLELEPAGDSASPPSVELTQPSGPYATPRRTITAAPGTIIGRYVVLARLGAGAMGLVLAAYDPELDRKVALKLLKFEGVESGNARTRLKREAQALAKLAHPNVVAVHDVGEHEGQLFVAMEFVEGETLGDWMRRGAEAGGRSWREVVAVFLAAGRGLAAAHGVGLVHRDFKPDNVMIGEDRRVRVMDFGLARAALDEEVVGEPSGAHQLSAEALLDSRMTHTGALLGTPAYMALELFAGAPADALSDQFGFCVALYEALYGERPFAGDNVGQLVHALETDALPEPAKGSAVPGWLRKVALRGLARAPEQRYPSMEALLDELGHDPDLRRRRWLATAGVVAALAVGGWGVWAATRPPVPVEQCSGSAAELEGVWDARRRAELEEALIATELAHAEQTWDRVAAGLDAYTSGWVEQRTAACEATQRGEQSAALLDAQTACLDRRLDHVRATVEVLADADAEVVDKAAEAVASLPSLAACDDLDALLNRVAPPEDPKLAAEIEALDQRLTRADVLGAHGKIEAGLAEAEAIVERAAALGYAPFETRALLVLARSRHDDGDYAASETAYVRAYELAVAQGMVDEAAEAAAQLVFVVGERLGRHAEGQRWALDARPFAAAAGTDEARALFLVNHGAQLVAEARYDEAKAAFEEAVGAWTRAYGPEHHRVGAALSNLGVVAARQGERGAARAYYERALAIYEAARGSEHPALAASLGNLGSLARSEGDYEAAEGYLRRALELSDRLGPEHPTRAFALNNLGSLAQEQGRYDEARDLFEQAQELWRQAHGLAHPHTLTAALNLGDVALHQRRYAEARAIYEELLPVVRETVGAEHILNVYPLRGLGVVELRQDHPREAAALLERALAVPGVVDGDPDVLAELRFALAEALWAAKLDRPRALELAELARTRYAEAGEAGEAKAERLAEVEAWLDTAR